MSEEVFNHYKEYMTTEEPCGYWIDGSVIYRKTINLGTMPNNDSKTVAHNIANLDKVIKIDGGGYSQSSGYYYPIPFAAAVQGWSIEVAVTSTNIVIYTTTDRSDISSYLTLYYTKSEEEEDD